MLCLTRKEGQRVRVRVNGGVDVWITLIEIDRNKIKLGIQGDIQTVHISREELLPLSEQYKESHP